MKPNGHPSNNTDPAMSWENYTPPTKYIVILRLYISWGMVNCPQYWTENEYLTDSKLGSGKHGDSLHLGVSQNGNIWCILHQVLKCSTEVYPHLATMWWNSCASWLLYHVISRVFHIQHWGWHRWTEKKITWSHLLPTVWTKKIRLGWISKLNGTDSIDVNIGVQNLVNNPLLMITVIPKKWKITVHGCDPLRISGQSWGACFWSIRDFEILTILGLKKILQNINGQMLDEHLHSCESWPETRIWQLPKDACPAPFMAKYIMFSNTIPTAISCGIANIQQSRHAWIQKNCC